MDILSISLIALSVAMTFLILRGYAYGVNRAISSASSRKRKKLKSLLFFIGIATYLIFLSQGRILESTSMPPRFILFLFIPFLLFTFWFYKSNKRNTIIEKIPFKWPVYYQTFRIIVEIFLLQIFLRGLIPESATFHGLNFDIIMGASAPLVALTIYGNKVNSFLAKLWNVIGIFMILFVAFIIGTSYYFPAIWGSEQVLIDPEFFTLPYLLIAGFLAPSAIFMHVFSLLQLKQLREE